MSDITAPGQMIDLPESEWFLEFSGGVPVLCRRLCQRKDGTTAVWWERIGAPASGGDAADDCARFDYLEGKTFVIQGVQMLAAAEGVIASA